MRNKKRRHKWWFFFICVQSYWLFLVLFFYRYQIVWTGTLKPTRSIVSFFFVGLFILPEIISFASNCRVNLVRICMFAFLRYIVSPKSVTVGIPYGCHKTIKIRIKKYACNLQRKFSVVNIFHTFLCARESTNIINS